MLGNLLDALKLNNGAFRNWSEEDEITYTFLNYVPSYYDPNDPHQADLVNAFRSFSAAERAYVTALLAEIARVADVTFREVTQPDESAAVGDITFGFSTYLPNPGAYGQVADASDPLLAGDIWLHDPSLAPGEGLITILHEGGHALGLRHSFEDVAGQPSYYTQTPSETEQWAVMSYTPYAGYAGSTSGHPMGWQLYDIAAVQSIYGANNATNAGDTAYDATAFNTTFVIWDGNGEQASRDTIDASAITSNSIIDLRPGSFSSISDLSNVFDNIAIAFGSYIEDAIGGAGDDIIVGNALSNRLRGGDGDDKIYGEGALRPDESPQQEDYRRVGQGGAISAPGYVQLFVDDRQLQKDTLVGGGGDDQLWGSRGDDELEGGAGSDLLYGWDGDDTALYGTGGAGVHIGIAPGSGTDSRIQANPNAHDANALVQAYVTVDGDVDTLVDIETINLTR